MTTPLRYVLAALSVGTALAFLHPAPSVNATPTAQGPTEVREVFSPDGTISRVRVPGQARAAVPQDAPLGEVRAEVVPIQRTGPVGERFDLVFVGDGYTADQLGLYHEHVMGRWNELTQVEPFKSLKGSFNVWQVNVISSESGVSNDPTYGVRKNTALAMGFGYGNMERTLLINPDRTQQFAALAPGADQVVALANSSKYGGSGGEIAMIAAGNYEAGQVLVHELGHSIGGLADEYDYPDDLYSGTEPVEANVSIHTAETMKQQRVKWHEFLGKPSPDGGVVGTYEGALYHKRGIYRPTENSVMRTLGRPFNLIGLDAMRKAILSKTKPSQ
ncbi:M64 family metallopeptidase [Allokutzneria albata]|uniref:IgA Peptidase M64 n=1 Tax=Allokutzneria albata TaxID=211114 RepID=A0A1G9Z9Y5_ALLAB|nr:M64 family metallopeptidase [Allokutzneria albata]SDN17426.1 IgA Peptidase M64 [Allokutzneria albata]